MKDAAFHELLTSVRQAGRIRRGRLKPGRVTAFKPADVKAVRAELGQSQEEFALMIGVSVATLRNCRSMPPVPAGMRRPTMTFSFRPSSVSDLPLTAASVRT